MGQPPTLRVGIGKRDKTRKTELKTRPEPHRNRFNITVKPFLSDFQALKDEQEREGYKISPEAEEEWKWEEFGHWFELMAEYTGVDTRHGNDKPKEKG
jgi:hypothetical protein